MNVLVFLPPCDGPHLTTHSICSNKEKNNKISSTHLYFIYLSYVCTLKHTLLFGCLVPPVYATGWRIPVSLQIKRATFIFITGRWQLLSQDAALIRNPVLYTALGNKLGGEGGMRTPDPSPQWGWTNIEGTHMGRIEEQMTASWSRKNLFMVFDIFIYLSTSGSSHGPTVLVRPVMGARCL